MLKSTVVLLICSIISKLLGFGREMAVAYKFGAGSISDAFVTTNSIPTVLFSAVSVAIGINFIPIITSIDNQDKGKRRNLFTSNIINVSLVLMIVGIVIMLLFPKIVLSIFAGGLSADAYEYAVKMLSITAFSVIPIVFAQILQSYLQVKNRFISTGMTGIICNLVVIAFTVLSDEKSYQLLSVGTLVSNIVMFGILALEAYHVGYRYTPILDYKSNDLKALVLLTCPLLLETLTSELNTIVDRNMASHLETGTITSLSYANNLVKMAYVMIATSLITTIFPRFSKYNAEKKI